MNSTNERKFKWVHSARLSVCISELVSQSWRCSRRTQALRTVAPYPVWRQGPVTPLLPFTRRGPLVRHAPCLLFFSAAARTVRCAKLDPATADRVRGAFVGALVADALSLATHYEYDATRIRKFYGAIDRYYAPGEKTGGTTHGVGWGARNFHGGNGNGPAKQAGEQTDYGDYLRENQPVRRVHPTILH